MPYPDLKSLPRYVREYPALIQRAWRREFNRAYAEDGEEVAFRKANAILAAYKKAHPDFAAVREVHVAIIGEARALAEEELAEWLAPGDVAQARQEDPEGKPLFVVYDCAHEGQSAGAIIHEGRKANVTKWWSGKRMRELASKLLSRAKAGLAKFWRGHTPDSEPDRPGVGRIFRAFNKKLGDVLHTFAAGAIYDRETKQAWTRGEIDHCSIEARVRFAAQPDGSVIVNEVRDAFGIALYPKDVAPGFAGATLVAALQECREVFARVQESTDPSTKETQKMEQGKVPTVSEVKLGIIEHNLQPGDLFGLQELLKVPGVADAMSAEIKEKVAEANTARDAEVAKLQERVKALEPLEAEKRNAAVKDLVDKSEKCKDLPKAQVAYLRDRLRVTLDGVDAGKEQEAVDRAIEAEIELAKKHGLQFAAAEDTAAAAPANEPAAKPGDLTDPANNDLIPQPAKDKQ